MTDALDMRSRIRSVNEKITYAAEVSYLCSVMSAMFIEALQMQSMLRELLTEVCPCRFIRAY